MGASGFDPAKSYQQQEEIFFDDGREVELLHFVYDKAEKEQDVRGNPGKVLAAIDEFGRTRKYLMNVGEDKGRIVTDLIKDRRPETMVELGGYIGYSCILFGAAVRDAGGKRYWSLERNPEFAAVASSLADLAGFGEIVKVVVGPSDRSIKRLHYSGELQRIDMMFLDHYKPAYTTDLKLCEELGLVSTVTIRAADNVMHPGNPPYLEYVRSSCDKNRQNTRQRAVNGVDTRFEDRTANQYKPQSARRSWTRSGSATRASSMRANSSTVSSRMALLFDFMIDKDQMDGLHSIRDGEHPVLYAIECNPRAHTAVALFNGTSAMSDAYTSLLDPTKSEPSLLTPEHTDKYYWIGHDLVELLFLPLVSILLLRPNASTCLAEMPGNLNKLFCHVVYWRDGTFERWDPLPWWWLYHVYWPMRFWQSLRAGERWSRINVSTTKVFGC